MLPSVDLLDNDKSNLFYLDKDDCKTIIDRICNSDYDESLLSFNESDSSKIDKFKNLKRLCRKITSCINKAIKMKETINYSLNIIKTNSKPNDSNPFFFINIK